jgi:hypothetical protein
VARIDILHQEGMLRIASFRNVLITVWNDAPDVPQIKAYSRIAQRFGAARPKSTALLNAIISGRPIFPEEVREEAVKVMRIRGVFNFGVSHLITVGGLSGTATRAFLSTAILLGRPKTPSKVFGNPREACDWLAARAGTASEPMLPDDLHTAYLDARAGW